MGLRVKDSAGNKKAILDYVRSNRKLPLRRSRLYSLIYGYTWEKSTAYDPLFSGEFNALLEELGIQRRRQRGPYTLEECKQEAKKYNTRTDWGRGSRYSYNAACRNKWMDECCSHMLTPSEAMSRGSGTPKPVYCNETSTVYRTQAIAGEKLGVASSSLSSTLSGRYKHVGGYTFRYATPEEVALLGDREYIKLDNSCKEISDMEK